jgi:hypothetical protein
MLVCVTKGVEMRGKRSEQGAWSPDTFLGIYYLLKVVPLVPADMIDERSGERKAKKENGLHIAYSLQKNVGLR